MTLDVVVIGGGAAGVAATRHLAETRPDLAIRLFEAGARLGGRARTVTAGSGAWPLDLGCGWLHGARDNAWTAIATRLGFALDDARAPWDGTPRRLELSPADDAAATEAVARFFQNAEARGGGDQDGPMSDGLDPEGRWNGMIGAIGTFINGVELDKASLQDFDRYDPGRGPDRRVRDGYGRLVETYGSSLPSSCGTIVRTIDHRGPTILVETDAGTVETRRVIVTVSTAVLAAEAIRFQPALPEKTEAASLLPLGVADKLFLAVPPDIALPPETHLLGSAFRTRTAAYHVGPFGRPLIECYFGGDLARAMERDRAAATDFATTELSDHFDADIVRQLRPVAASAWAGEPLIGGSYSFAKPGAAGCRDRLAAPVDDRLFFAGEACSRHRFSTAHGAFETGISAASAVAATFGTR